jgi:CHAT domain-containing protein/Tfp pilus assembly protein PilF
LRLPAVSLFILLVWIGLPAAAWPPSGSSPMPVSDDKRGAAQSAEESHTLEPGKSIERELSGGRSHFYKITMTSGQYLQIAVSQQGIDVLVALYTPDGKKIDDADSVPATAGSETISAIAEAAGAYMVEVRSDEKTAQTGRYEIKVEELRAATTEDKYRVAGEMVFREAERLENGTTEDKRKSIEKFHEALDLYRRAGDRIDESRTLNSIGEVYNSLGEMQKALEKYNEALPISRAVGDSNGEAIILNNIGSVHQSMGEMQKALEKFNESLLLRRAVGDRRGEAVTLNNIGGVYRSLGEIQKALEKYNEALPLRRAVGDRRGEAITLNNIGAAYDTLGETQKALEKYNESLLLRRMIGDRNGEAAALHNIGVVYWSLGEMQKALEKYNETLPLRRAVGDRNGEAITLSSIGLIYDSLGEMQKALEKYNESLLLRRAVGDRRGEAVTLNNIGSVYQLLGETQKALEKFNESLLLKRAVGDRRGEAVTLNNIGSLYRSLGEIQKALEKYNEALPIRRAVGDRRGEATSLHNIGLIYNLLGETQKALEKYNEALPISRAVGDRRVESATLHNIGGVYRSLGETQKALEKFDEALLLKRTIGDRIGEAATLHNIGLIHQSLGETQKALEKFNEALPIFRFVGDRNGEAAALLGIAQVEQQRGNLTQARQTIEQAVGMIESLRTKIAGQELRASYFASRQEFYQTYIDVLMRMQMQNPAAAFDSVALEVSEQASARSLLELLTESRADIRQGVDGSLLEREHSLQQLLNAKAAAQFALLNRKHTPAQAEAFAKEIASLTTEYDELKAQIRARDPRYAALTQPQPLSLAEIQKQVLDPDTLLLEYSLGDDASYLFVASQTSLTSHQLPKRAEIEAATRRVRELLTAPQSQPDDTAAKYQARIRKARADYWMQAAALSRMLLGPVASQLSGKRLLIVADGALQYLPFGALPVPDVPRAGEWERGGAGERESGRGREAKTRLSRSPTLPLSPSPTPLIVEHEIVHLPSASALAVLRRELAGRQPAEKAVAVLADPVFSADDPRVKSGGQTPAGGEAAPDLMRAIDDVRGDLRRLLMTRGEAEAILSLTPLNAGLKALDFQADRATATSDELGHYRIVHFATHGLLNSQHPELSGLALSLVDERGRPQDGFLRLHEIFNLRLPAELVVLSACQTGLGKEVKGEGLVGLTRGFMYAGAARVVASLWRVDDTATAELMKLFYRRMLRDRMRPAAALREAQVEMWKRAPGRSPFYWAGFVLQGEWR